MKKTENYEETKNRKHLILRFKKSSNQNILCTSSSEGYREMQNKGTNDAAHFGCIHLIHAWPSLQFVEENLHNEI